MTDVHDKQTRSYNMSQIRGKDTKPEMLVRRFLFSKDFDTSCKRPLGSICRHTSQVPRIKKISY